MPTTQLDLWIWIASGWPGQAFDAAIAAIEAQAPHSVLAEEVVAWNYYQNRDLIGFIDGTENPNLLEAPHVALFPQAVPEHTAAYCSFKNGAMTSIHLRGSPSTRKRQS